jgi:hypothetical protein
MNDRPEGRPRGWKKYQRPELEILGSVQEFTHLIGTSSNDGLTGTHILGGAKTRKPLPNRRRA